MAKKRREVQQLCSVFTHESANYSWDDRWGTSPYSVGTGNVNRPPTPADYQQARRWARVNHFVSGILKLRLAFYNFGMLGQRTFLKDPKKPKTSELIIDYHPGIQAVERKNDEKLRDWKRDKRAAISRYFDDAWMETLVVSSTIGFWRKGGSPIVIHPEDCKYEDKLGEEVLTITHGFTDDQIRDLPIPEAQKKRLRESKQLKLRKGDPMFSFDVVKREQSGYGLGWPELVAIFHACAMHENLDVSDRELADACRRIYEQHRCGYEIKSGMRAGYADRHLTKPRADGILKDVKNASGRKVMVTNFDHLILIGAGLPDPKVFASSRYETPINKLAQWAMPIGQMVLGKTVNPFLMSLLRVQAETERTRMEPHFNTVLRDSLKAPCEIRLQWDSSIFWDSRLMFDVMKQALIGGTLSQTTFNRNAGFDHVAELGNKEDEHEMPEHLTHPAFDSAHGKEKAPGKPPGTKDRS